MREYSDRPGGAFPDPGAQDRYDGFVAAIRCVAAGFREAGFDRLAARIDDAAEELAMCVLYPGLSPTTHRIEKIMRRNEDGNIRHMLISPPGRKRHSDARACMEMWREQGIDPFYEMQSVAGAAPSREWAQVRTEGARARAFSPAAAVAAATVDPSIAAAPPPPLPAAEAAGGGTAGRAARAGEAARAAAEAAEEKARAGEAAATARAAAEAAEEKARAGEARARAAAELVPAGPEKRAARRTKRGRRGRGGSRGGDAATPGGAPATRQRRLAVAGAPAAATAATAAAKKPTGGSHSRSPVQIPPTPPLLRRRTVRGRRLQGAADPGSRSLTSPLSTGLPGASGTA